MPYPTPYPDVNRFLHDFLAGAQAALGERFVGLYLYGSLALGDFDPRSSDIDFVVVTEEEPLEEAVRALRHLHERLGADHPRWGRELEGSYIPRKEMRRYDPARACHWHVFEGRLFREEHGVHWVIERHVLRERGVALAGPPPQALIDPVSPEQLREAVVGLVRSWWAPMVADPARLRDPKYRIYAVLTMCRVWYTLEHGALASKPVAGRWAREALGERWRGLIDRSLAGQADGDGDAAAEVRALIAYTVQRCEQS